MIIAVDFDGTCVTHDYPLIGANIGAEKVLKKLTEKGHKIILWTMRSGETLDDAVKWFKDHDIELWGINKNPEQTWSSSPKAYAQLYIDDASICMPLSRVYLSGNHVLEHKRHFVDWRSIEFHLKQMNIL